MDDAVILPASGVDGYFNPSTEKADSDDAWDWYSFNTKDGRFTLVMTDVPADVQAGMDVYRASDTSALVAWESSWEYGGDLRIDVDQPPGTAWIVQLYGFAEDALNHGVGEAPAHLTQPYSLTLED